MAGAVLIETSAVLAVLGKSSSPHNKFVAEALTDSELHSSVYIRMEFIKRWICDLIQFAELLTLSASVGDAFEYWSHQYGRGPKFVGQLINFMQTEKIQLVNDKELLARELADFAVKFLFDFDFKLRRHINNRARCEIGAQRMEVDFRTALQDLSVFRRQFLRKVDDCGVATLLQPGEKHGRVTKLKQCENVKKNSKITGAIETLPDSPPISCTDCWRVGDVVIASEQPRFVTLFHIDASFDDLCTCTGRKHIRLPSSSSFKPKSAPTDPGESAS